MLVIDNLYVLCTFKATAGVQYLLTLRKRNYNLSQVLLKLCDIEFSIYVFTVKFFNINRYFLSGRSMADIVNIESSKSYVTNAVLTQRSLLGSILFLTYINENIIGSWVNIQLDNTIVLVFFLKI